MKILPCPLCKKDDLLCAGPRSAGGGIGCLRCHLVLLRPAPKIYPRDTPKHLQGMAAVRWLNKRQMKLAIKSWNRLPR